MAKRFQLDLKTFDISSQTSKLSLSMTSVAFIYDVPLRNVTQDNLSSLIQSKQLWLLPRGLCRLDVCIQLVECNIGEDERAGFFEFIADTIYQSFLWSQLGLSVKILDIQYHQENIPNLYFSIEQPDMSSALLSPPHAPTAQIKGLECILRFESSSHLTANSKEDEQISSQPWVTSPIGALASCRTSHTSDVVDLWENAAYLVEAALCITFGTRKRIQGLKIVELEKAPSLLELAPATWNSHYLKSTINHTKNFAVISNILASSLKGQSPQLRRKGAGLLKDNIAEDNHNPSQKLEQRTKQLESSIQRRLWGLLQDTLEPAIGTTNVVRKCTSLNAGPDPQDYEMDGTVVDEGIVDQYDLSDELHYSHGNLQQLPGQGYDDYGSSASYGSDVEFAWQQVCDFSTPFQDDELPEAPEFWAEVGSLYDEAEMFSEQIPETNTRYPKSDLSYTMQDHAMTDCMYDENDGICGHSCGHASYVGQENLGYEMTEISDCWDNGGKENIHRGAMEEDIHKLGADEEHSW